MAEELHELTATGVVDTENGNGDENGDEDEDENTNPTVKLTPEEKAAGFRVITASTEIKQKDKAPFERSLSFKYFVGNKLADAVERYGEQVIWDLYDSQIVVKAGQRARREMADLDKTDDQIREFMESWKLEPKQPRGFRPIRNVDAINHMITNMDSYEDLQLARVFSMIANRFPGGVIPPHLLAQMSGGESASSPTNGDPEPEQDEESETAPVVEPVGRVGRRR